MQKKYQVFVSSTFRDLTDERQNVIRHILDSNHIPAGMELFPAADMTQLTYIEKIIDECDYYLLLVGGRYGSVDAEGISYTEREYDYAVSKKKIVIAFVHNNVGKIAFEDSESEPSVREALEKFRSKVMTNRLVKTWTTPQELETAVLKSLMYAFNQMPQVGWVRGDSVASDEALSQANRAMQENADLKLQIEALRATPALNIENLADINDTFDVRYTSLQYTQEGPLYYETVRKLTWKQLFLALAGNLPTLKPNEMILEAVRVAMEDLNVGPKPEFLNASDRDTIRVQLEVLGLTEDNRNNTTRRVELTPKGKQVYLAEKAVKKA